MTREILPWPLARKITSQQWFTGDKAYLKAEEKKTDDLFLTQLFSWNKNITHKRLIVDDDDDVGDLFDCYYCSVVDRFLLMPSPRSFFLTYMRFYVYLCEGKGANRERKVAKTWISVNSSEINRPIAYIINSMALLIDYT